jgi:hypothetical protein
MTLIPNVVEIDSETSLVDIVGYNNHDNYIEVICIFYFLKSKGGEVSDSAPITKAVCPSRTGRINYF